MAECESFDEDVVHSPLAERNRLHLSGVVRGVHANPVLLAFLNDTIAVVAGVLNDSVLEKAKHLAFQGREVIVETRDGQKYEGIFAACSPDPNVCCRSYLHGGHSSSSTDRPSSLKAVAGIDFQGSSRRTTDSSALGNHGDVTKGVIDSAIHWLDNFEVGLRLAHALPSDDLKRLLPHRSDIIEKLLFEPGFATDQEYHGHRNGVMEDSLELSSEFEVWVADGDEDGELETDNSSVKSAVQLNGGDGWSVDEMFNANNALGVKSTFEDNLSQYTTANVEGDGEARLRAERIAQEIEMNPASRVRARMENDDEERDLNKETPEFQVNLHRRAQNAAGRTNCSGNARGGGGASSGPNRSGQQATNRRADGAGSGGRAGRVGTGSYGSGGGSGTSRSFTNSSLSHGVKGSGGGGSASAYAGAPARYQPSAERPSAQAVHSEFGQWTEVRTGVAMGGAQKVSIARRGDQQAPASTKVFESSHRSSQQHRISARSPMNRSGDESRSVHHSGSPHAPGSSPSSGSGVGKGPTTGSGGAVKGSQAERVRGLRDFHQNFNNAYQSTSSRTSFDESQGNVPSTAAPTAAKPANAWNKGPPASIRSAAASSQPTSSTHQTGGSAAAKESMLKSSLSSEQLQQQATQKPNASPTSSQPSTPHSAQGSHTGTTSPSVSTDRSSCSTLTEFPQRATPSAISGEGAAASGGSPSATPAPPAPPPIQTNATAPPTPHAGTPGALSGTASSSSIAPTDPTPSATTTATSDHGSTNTNSATSTATSGKKFEFNPDAQPFTPRSVAAHTPTPQSTPAPQPLLAAHSTPLQMHGIALNAPQAIPLTQGIQPGGMMAQAAPPQMFPYAASAGVYGTAVPVYYGTTQPMMQAGAQLAQGVSVGAGAANVASGPLMASTGAATAQRGGAQLGTAAPTGRRPQQQQQLVQGGGVYVPGQAMPYPQQMIPAQYQVPFYTTAPYQQMSVASANVPPPSVPPPTSSAVAVGGAPPQPFQVIQAQSPHQQAVYSRQIYQSGQPLNYMVATAGPRYAQPHQTIEYIGGVQQCSQQPSSAGSSNGNSSNGHNSQPATPGPQPVASPAQVSYPVSGTPQSPHPFVVPVPNAPPHHPQHMYVHPAAAQFPLFSAGQAAGSYVVYSAAHQQMMQMHPSAVQTSTQVPLSQAHNPLHHTQVFSRFLH
ncbi:unnamed protein product [Toxocara canis]|uniref:LsmAD domain-containing protein n=1 Tax=Toxocara canis TaxID=6265 RepID=A0A183UNC1_TOXCA|nr:unnamed protein product [Toxocara canis]